jgi:hypothetical protein
MREKSIQRAANIAKVGLIIVWGVFMYTLIKNS